MKREFVDQIGHHLEVEFPPQRIVSLVPSQTELLSYLGLGDEVVGITKFCIHPASWFDTKKRVGGTKKIDFKKVEELYPDLIICNKEENEEQQVKQLMEKYPVWTSDIHNLNDALEMIDSVGEIVDKADTASKLCGEIKSKFEKLSTSLNKLPQMKVVYLIWQNPFMAAGKDTFIDNMLSVCNFINVCSLLPSRYPELSVEEIRELKPDMLLLSSEPYPFSEKHLDSFTSLFPGVKPVLVDGEYFSWYGSRLLQAAGYLENLVTNITKLQNE